MLGFVSPFAVRLEVVSVAQSGNTAGSLYALSTVGSLIGTFATVFAFIPTIGTRRTLLGLSLLLLATSLAGLLRRRPLWAALVLPAVIQLAFSPGPVRAAEGGKLVYETESAYYYIQVVQHGSQRELVLDEGHAVHSIYNPRRLLTGEYWDDFLLAPLFQPHYTPASVHHVAILGLGGGTAARLFLAAYPKVLIDAAEIDPAIVGVAYRYFALPRSRLAVHVEDARYFLLTHSNRYDVVAVDAFHQPYIPFQLTTSEFFALVRKHLSPGGTVAINCGHAATDYRLVDAIAHTMEQVFPSVFIVDVPGSINSVVVASAASVSLDTFSQNLARASGLTRTVGMRADSRVRPAPRTGAVFTDDLAPVEQLIDQIVLDYVRHGN
jgi:spermidine synthase